MNKSDELGDESTNLDEFINKNTCMCRFVKRYFLNIQFVIDKEMKISQISVKLSKIILFLKAYLLSVVQYSKKLF